MCNLMNIYIYIYSHTQAHAQDYSLSPTVESFTRPRLDPFARAKYSWLLEIHSLSERELADNISD